MDDAWATARVCPGLVIPMHVHMHKCGLSNYKCISVCIWSLSKPYSMCLLIMHKKVYLHVPSYLFV